MRRIKVNKLFHLSEENHDGEIFIPRIPESIWQEEDEDTKTKRICFSVSLSGAFRAINFDGCTEELYVHVPENMIKTNRHCWQPSDEEVIDAAFTGEKWITCKTRMKCIGKASFRYDIPRRINRTWRPKVYIKWIERYENNRGDDCCNDGI